MMEERDAWHGRAVEAWRQAWGVPALRVFEAVGSTNDVAREMADHGASEGATVIADRQTRGRGRRGRAWLSQPGQSLLLSMVVRPSSRDAESVLPIRLGLATARAIEQVTPLTVGLKWPNDLVVDGRKVGGMLCEGVVEGDRPAYVVAGTGINVLQPDDAWPADLAGRVTSLAVRAGESVSVTELAGRVTTAWLDAVQGREGPLSQDELAAYRARDVLAGRRVTVDGRAGGVARGVEADGSLRLRDERGQSRRVVAGTIRLAEADGEEGPE